MSALQEDIAATEVAKRHFTSALQEVTPSPCVSGAELEMYGRFQQGIQ